MVAARAQSLASHLPGRVGRLVAPLLAPDTMPGGQLASWIELALTVTLIVANVIGAVVVALLIAVVIPEPAVAVTGRVRVANVIAGAAYIAVAVPIGYVWGLRHFDGLADWLASGAPPSAREQRMVLTGPLHLLKVQAALWLVAVVLFGALNATFAGSLARNFALTVALAGTSTCAITYLLSERVLRPITTRVLVEGLPERQSLPGVTARALLAWGLGTGVAVLGLALVAAFTLAGATTTVTKLSVTILALTGTALVIGGLVTILAARATADPIQSVADALAQVQAGRFDVRVPVYDGTEIGLLQSGFNRMSAGLAERERLRELFGRQVGEDVARAALEGDIELGGEERDVAVLFVDLIGSTALASDRPPQEVVAVINRFFAVVVQAVDREGGWINKFEGDGALAIFGAPIALPDAYGRALAAARAAAAELARQLPEYPAAVGVSAGLAVAGHIGERQRYEYTVIGDPVNEAARLTELAKTAPGRVLASEAVVRGASPAEAAAWELAEAVTLRGRSRPTRLAHPRAAGGPASD